MRVSHATSIFKILLTFYCNSDLTKNFNWVPHVSNFIFLYFLLWNDNSFISFLSNNKYTKKYIFLKHILFICKTMGTHLIMSMLDIISKINLDIKSYSMNIPQKDQRFFIRGVLIVFQFWDTNKLCTWLNNIDGPPNWKKVNKKEKQRKACQKFY